MDAERWKRVRAVFDEAIELRPDQRAAFIAHACIDVEDRNEVEAMLAAATTADATSLSQLAPDLLAELPSDVDPEPDQARTGQRYGAWQIIRPLGRGGMGMVYLAERVDGGFTQRAALKVVRNVVPTNEVLTRFRYERQILANLAHPNIAQLLDGGAGSDGDPYLAMEYIEGTDLRSYCDENKLDVDSRLRLFLTVCNAVSYAHERLVLHRDLKPANVLVAHDGTVKLLDFGVAKLIGEEHAPETTIVGQRLFTPEYAAPEQISGETTTVAVDVYSLGVMLCETLTGQRPYKIRGRTPAAIEQSIRDAETILPSALVARTTVRTNVNAGKQSKSRHAGHARLRKQLRGDLDAIVLKALRKSPLERYVTVSALADDIRAYLNQRPVLARRGSRRYRVWRFLQRHAVPLAFGSLALLSLVAGSIVAMWQAFEAREQRDAAVSAQHAAEHEARKARTALDFMNRMFEQADPSRTRGGDVTAREMLEKGAIQAREGLADEPDILSEMLTAMGKAHIGLGLNAEAAPLLKEAGALNRDQLAAQVDTAYAYATALARMGRHQDVLDLLLPLQARVLASNEKPELAAKIGKGIATIYSRLQRMDEAEAEYQKALAIEEKVFGPAHRETQSTLLAIANQYTTLGRNEEARQLAERVVLSLRDSPERDEGDFYVIALGVLARALRGTGAFAQAETVDRETLELRQKIFGEDHPTVAETMGELAASLSGQHRYEEAIALHTKAVEGYRKHYGTDHYATAYSADMLASDLSKIGRSNEARTLAEDALRVTIEAFGEQHYRTALSLSILGAIELDDGNYPAARDLAERAIRAWEPSNGPKGPLLAAPLVNLAASNLLGRFPDTTCEPATRALKIAESNARESDSERLYCQAVLDACLANTRVAGKSASLDGIRATLADRSDINPFWLRMLARLSKRQAAQGNRN
jgi:serine/threonine-protein kinase